MRDVETLAELDLEQELGLMVSPSVAAEIVALDDRLDRLERPWRGWRRYGWSVATGRRRVDGLDGHSWGALGRVLAYPAAADDLFELSVDVWRHAASPLVVQATVVVGCFCDDDHEIHTVADQEWRVRDGVEVRDGLVSAVTTLESWAALDLDPDGWRARTGLPLRSRTASTRSPAAVGGPLV